VVGPAADPVPAKLETQGGQGRRGCRNAAPRTKGQPPLLKATQTTPMKKAMSLTATPGKEVWLLCIVFIKENLSLLAYRSNP
jgi:hypothetical protein